MSCVLSAVKSTEIKDMKTPALNFITELVSQCRDFALFDIVTVTEILRPAHQNIPL